MIQIDKFDKKFSKIDKFNFMLISFINVNIPMNQKASFQTDLPAKQTKVDKSMPNVADKSISSLGIEAKREVRKHISLAGLYVCFILVYY